MSTIAATSSREITNCEIPLIIEKLCPDILQLIFSRLGPKDLQSVTSVCRYWKHMSITVAISKNRERVARLVKALLNEFHAVRHAETIEAIDKEAKRLLDFEPCTLKEVKMWNPRFRGQIRQVLFSFPPEDLSRIVESFKERPVIKFVTRIFWYVIYSRQLQNLSYSNHLERDRKRVLIMRGFLEIDEIHLARFIADFFLDVTLRDNAYKEIIAKIYPNDTKARNKLLTFFANDYILESKFDKAQIFINAITEYGERCLLKQRIIDCIYPDWLW